MKLSVREAILYIQDARKLVKKSCGILRFGQALWNILPKEVTAPHHGSDKDFFYRVDDEAVLKTFYEHYTEGDYNA